MRRIYILMLVIICFGIFQCGSDDGLGEIKTFIVIGDRGDLSYYSAHVGDVIQVMMSGGRLLPLFYNGEDKITLSVSSNFIYVNKTKYAVRVAAPGDLPLITNEIKVVWVVNPRIMDETSLLKLKPFEDRIALKISAGQFNPQALTALPNILILTGKT
jgi:hypothetical protein